MTNSFLQDLKNSAVVLYGSGTMGQFLAKVLKMAGIDIACFAVSDNSVDTTKICSKNVYPISSSNFKNNDYLFIITANKKNTQGIIPELEKRNFNYISLNESLLNLTWDTVINYYHMEKILDDLRLNDNLYYKNVFRLSVWEQWNFLIEMCDIILPVVYSDYNLLTEGPYLYKNVKFQKGDIVFDCGANVGIFSNLAASFGCKVYAFEPTPNPIIAFDKSRINLINQALSDRIGLSDFALSELNSGANSMVFKENTKKTIQIECSTIDSFVNENNIDHVDFIKADIEGSERQMLTGAIETLKRFSPKLSICTYHLPDDPHVLEEIIKDANPNYFIEHKWLKLFAYVPNTDKQ